MLLGRERMKRNVAVEKKKVSFHPFTCSFAVHPLHILRSDDDIVRIFFVL